MYQFQLPDIGEGVVEAEVIAWHVAEGDDVALDQVLVELMTDKANVEIPSPAAGRVAKLCFGEGDIVPVGAVLIEIDDGHVPAEAVSPPVRSAQPKRAAPGPAASAAPAAPSGADAKQPPAQPSRPRSSQRATSGRAAEVARAVPAVRALAERLGVDLASVRGTGPGGRIMRRDVEDMPASGTAPEVQQAAPQPSAATRSPPENDAADWERVPLRGLRRSRVGRA